MATAGPRGISDCDRRIVQRALRDGLSKSEAARRAHLSLPTVRKIAAESQAKDVRRP